VRAISPVAASEDGESQVHVSDQIVDVTIEIPVIFERLLVTHAVVADLFAIRKMEIEKRNVRRCKALIVLFL
jgi:hypothetical protein